MPLPIALSGDDRRAAWREQARARRARLAALKPPKPKAEKPKPTTRPLVSVERAQIRALRAMTVRERDAFYVSCRRRFG